MSNNLVLLRLLSGLLLVWQIQSCGTTRWYSIEQEPAEPFAYIHDGVIVHGDYIRSASITEIDGKTVEKSTDGKLKISIGTHQVKINCDEAKGSYDSNELVGQARVLEFEAKTQRTYKAICIPFTHWWVEDLENGKIVAGQKLSI